MKLLNTGFVAFLTVALSLYCQSPKTDYEVGGGVQYQIYNHNGEFSKLNEIPNCCPEFKSGDGTGFSALLFYKLPLNSMFDAQVRLAYSSYDALFLSTESTWVNVDGVATRGEFEHRLEANLSSVNIQPIISYNVFNHLYLNIGFNLGFLMSGTFYQIEQITKPTDRGTYIKDGVDTEKRQWNEAQGDIPNIISLQYGILAGLSYNVPLNASKTLWASPEVYYSYGLTNVADKTPWKVNTLSAGLTMMYRPNFRSNDITAPIDNLDKDGNILSSEIELAGNLNDIYFGEFSIPELEQSKPKPKINAMITAVGVADGQEQKDATMVVEEFLSTNMRPLLNYIFFDNNSSDILDRYYQLEEADIAAFSNKSLCNKTTIRTYHDALNILGSRLTDNPDAKLNLIGCNSGKESGGTGLSQRRADVIKSYLTNNWKINSNRINTSARNLPEIASAQNEQDGIEENRRVEFKSPSWDVMKPVVTEDTLRKVSPPVIRFYIKTESENVIKGWKITAIQNGTLLRVFEGKGKVPESIDWQIDREKETVPKFSAPIEYMIELVDEKDNQSISETGVLPTDMITIQKKKDNRVGDKRIDRYSLILFDFASSNLSADNDKIIDFIKGNLQKDSRLLISGFTDRTGNEDANFKLSDERAKKVALGLGRPSSFTRPVGESELIYDNNFPEGRFYCRTVEVEVETPISWNK